MRDVVLCAKTILYKACHVSSISEETFIPPTKLTVSEWFRRWFFYNVYNNTQYKLKLCFILASLLMSRWDLSNTWNEWYGIKIIWSSLIPVDFLYDGRKVWALQWRHNGRDGISNHQPHDCLLNRLFRPRSNKTWKLRVTGLCEGNSPVTGEFPTQRTNKAENFSSWWSHHGKVQM